MKRIMLIMSLAVLSFTMLAQQQGRGKFNPEEFRAKLEGFVTAEAGFNNAEAQAFFPIYHEMKGKQRELQRSIFKLKKDAKEDDASNKDYAATIQEIKSKGVEIAQIEADYYKKMCKAVPSEKVYRAMCAEDKFHRMMLEDFEHNGNRPRGHGKDRQDKQ